MKKYFPKKFSRDGLDKPYMYGGRDFLAYNLKSKRWRGLIAVPSDEWLAKKRAEGLGSGNERPAVATPVCQKKSGRLSELHLARQCLNFQGFRCGNKYCLTFTCPLNSKHEVKE